MPTLREIHEKVRSRQRSDAGAGDGARPDRVIEVLRSAGVVESAQELLGDALLALSVVPITSSDEDDEENDTKEDKSSDDSEWALVVITSNIEPSDSDVTAFASRPSTLFGRLQRALRRQGVDAQVKAFLQNAILRYGVSADAFAVSKIHELRERQRAIDLRQLRLETKSAVLQREIAYRQVALRALIKALQVRCGTELGSLGGLSFQMQHLDALREEIFFDEKTEYVEELVKGRLFD
jgi:hypothetical protein